MGQYEPPPLESPPTTGFERFRESWVSALQDEAFVSYVQSMLPNSLDSIATFDRSAPFASDPGSSFRPFLYDAVTGAALSMCRATNASFTGQEVFQQFAELDFDGTSGRVKIDNETGTRDYTTISFAMWNIQVQGANAEGNAIVDFVPAFSFEQDTWRPIATNEFIYSNGMTIAPDSLPKVDYNPNYIGQAGRIVGYTLMGITMASAIASLLWLIWYRKEHVIASAQPLFLFMVSSGVIVMSSTIVPLGLEEPVVLTPQGLNVACMSSIWCYIMGATITFSALFAKTKGVHLVSVPIGACL